MTTAEIACTELLRTEDGATHKHVAPDADDMKALHEEILACLPHLRAFAHLLARDRLLAEDLVHDTIERALSRYEQFEPGTNFRGWLIIILRNIYFNDNRRRRRTSEIMSGMDGVDRPTSGGQEERIEVRDFERAFERLSPKKREALLLVGISGFSYEEAAKITESTPGTIKSRVSRARAELEEGMDGGEKI